jgi:hypothetical protein
MTKRQIRQSAIDRLAAHGDRIEAEAERVWTAPETLAHIGDYVARTLRKA